MKNRFSFFSSYLSGLLVLRNLVYLYQVSNLWTCFSCFFDTSFILNEILVANSNFFCFKSTSCYE